MNKRRKLGLIFATLGVLLMSIESPLIKMTNINASNVTFYLGICIFISANFIILLKGKKYFIKSYSVQTKGIILASLCTALANAFFVKAIMNTGVANTVLILASSPIFSAFVVWILFRKTTSITLFISTFFVVFGIFVVLFDQFTEFKSMLGIFFAFLCMIFMSLSFIVLNRFSRASRLSFISLSGLWLTILAIPFADFVINLQACFIILLLGILTMPISRYFIGLSSARILPQELSLLVILESILAPLWAWWWLDSELKINVLIGGAIILMSIVVYILKSSSRA